MTTNGGNMEWVVLSVTGRIARIELSESIAQARLALEDQPRGDHDLPASMAETSDGIVGAVSSCGNAYLLQAADLPLIDSTGNWSLADAPAMADVRPLPDGERIVGLYSLDLDAAPLALGTVAGVVKRVVPEYKGWESWQVIALKDDDQVVGIAHASDADDVVFVTSDAQLLRTSAREVRPQGRAAGGMAGIKLNPQATVIFFSAVAKADKDMAAVATFAVGDDASSVKISRFADFPAKGRATAGVRAHRFLKGQDHLAAAWVGLPPVRACDSRGGPRNVPAADDRRDGAGTKVYGPFFAFG